MAKIKKVNPEWNPTEKKADGTSWEVGDIVEITDYRQLVRSGAAVLVDAAGNEIGLPGEKYRCAVCTKELSELPAFVAHVKNHERVTSTVTPQVAASVAATLGKLAIESTSSVTSEVTAKEEEIKAKRIAALAKAREVRAANIAGKVVPSAL